MNEDEKYLISVSEWAEREGKCIKTAKRYIQQGKISIIKIKSPGGYGKNGFENRIHYTQLSTPEKQEAFLRDRGLLPPKEAETDKDKNVIDLKPWQKKEADRREATVKEYIEVGKDIPKRKIRAFKRDFAKRHSIHWRTLERWVKAYQAGGYYAIVPNWHSGNQKKLINKELSKVIEDIYLKAYGPSIKETWEKISKWCDDRDRQAPSYNSLVDYINGRWTKSQQLLIRNKQEWDRIYSPYVRRDWEQVVINEVWVADFKQIDICCLFKGKPIFPWLMAWLDARSRRFVGWILWPTHNTYAASQSFCYAVNQCGVPGTAYLDLGKEFRSLTFAGTKVKKGPTVKVFEGLDKTVVPGILRDLGVEVFYSSPYNAREKIIEPAFKVFTHRLKDLPGYRGHSTKTRPKKIAREIKDKKLLSFEDLSAKIDEIITDRNARPHSTTGLAPDSYYEAFTPVVPSRDLLNYLLMDTHIKKVKDSTVSIQGLVYRGEELWRLAGEEVEVRRDPKDITRAVIIREGKVFGPAYLEEADHYRGPITLESVKTCQRIRQKISKFRKFVIENEDVIDDPLRVAVELESQGEIRQRDIRPADPSIRRITQKDRLSKAVKKVLEDDPEENRKSKVATANRPSFSRLFAGLEGENKQPPRRRYRLTKD